MIKMFLEEVRWGKLDYLLIDLPPGTGDVALDIHTLIPKCNELIVTTPHYAAASVASRAGYMAAKNNHKIIGVIENMSYLTLADGQVLKVFGQGGGEKSCCRLRNTTFNSTANRTTRTKWKWLCISPFQLFKHFRKSI